ncbi:hypothetical protein NTGBS_250026 [Candidatus Nitrotoga sp. BS]|uniref:hypothetical protein n=1 Tax=Candidatus Nitrotoga sp. BS TaxID=2890408 RepID=UPI001EF2C35F|nr:hypothetical protein [Candidatus Nitrotoga sp. BS]CAH1197442.1 hypothetical protein NTGBS_250026 [Candidatus Nitrotoga sp. BS]
MPDKFFALTLALAAMQGANLCVLERVTYDLLMRAVWLEDGIYLQPERQAAIWHAQLHCSAAFELDR